MIQQQWELEGRVSGLRQATVVYYQLIGQAREMRTVIPTASTANLDQFLGGLRSQLEENRRQERNAEGTAARTFRLNNMVITALHDYVAETLRRRLTGESPPSRAAFDRAIGEADRDAAYLGRDASETEGILERHKEAMTRANCPIQPSDADREASINRTLQSTPALAPTPTPNQAPVIPMPLNPGQPVINTATGTWMTSFGPARVRPAGQDSLRFEFADGRSLLYLSVNGFQLAGFYNVPVVGGGGAGPPLSTMARCRTTQSDNPVWGPISASLVTDEQGRIIGLNGYYALCNEDMQADQSRRFNARRIGD